MVFYYEFLCYDDSVLTATGTLWLNAWRAIVRRDKEAMTKVKRFPHKEDLPTGFEALEIGDNLDGLFYLAYKRRLVSI